MEDTHLSLRSKAGTSIVAEIRKSLAPGHNNGSVGAFLAQEQEQEKKQEQEQEQEQEIGKMQISWIS